MQHKINIVMAIGYKIYKIVFKLPCGRAFSFDISVYNDDDYDPTTEVGRHPSWNLLNYYLLYVPDLQEFSGSEISDGIVMSVYQKNDVEVKTPSINDKTENEPKHETETAPSFKSLYWKNGYIVKSRGNGYGIISNDVVFFESGSFHKSRLDESLMVDSLNSIGYSDDIMEVWCNSSTRGFNPYREEEVHKCCNLVWTRPIKMTREEIEKQLNLRKGSLVITD